MLKNKILSILILSALLSLTAYGGTMDGLLDPASAEVADENVKTIDIIINGNSKVQMKDVPKTGYLEVYSILGVKVKSISLGSIDATYEGLSLPKGIYILRAGKVAQKIIAT